MSTTPELVVVKVPTETPDTFWEMKLTPDEAEEFGLAIILEAKRAKRYATSSLRYEVVR